MTVDFGPVFQPYLDKLRMDVGGRLELYDTHTHVGANDPDGFTQTRGQLLAQLAACDARGVVFAMSEPGGYTDGAANDAALQAAHDAPDRLVAFTRLDPNEAGALHEARRCLDAGARGIKLHPRGQAFTLDHPVVEELVAEAHDRHLPVLIHAGRGIPALGEHTVLLSRRYPDAGLILAHAGISDLAWLWRVLPAHPNVFVDTSWWNPSDIVALFTLAPPGQVLWASDSPYGIPLVAAVEGLRCAVQAGLTDDQIRAVAGGQIARLVAGEEPLDHGPAPRIPVALDPTLERAVAHLCSCIGQVFARADPGETLALARLALAVSADDEVAPIAAAATAMLDAYEAQLAPPPPGQGFPASIRYLIAALFVARTPAAGVPG